MAEQATCEELAELALDEARHAAPPCRSLGQKSFEVFLYNSIQERILGCAALVFDGGNLLRDREGEEPSRRAIRVPCAGEIRAAQTHLRLAQKINREMC